MERAELKEQTQLKRTTADCKPGAKQSLNFTDNRLLNTSQRRLITNIQKRSLKANSFISQMQRIETKILPVNDSHASIKIKGVQYNICEHGSVTVPAKKKPKKGSPTSGDALWMNTLMDTGTEKSATRLHVVNANFGGVGTNEGGNLHPGSQSLNGHHKNAENKFKNLLDDPSKNNSELKYDCSFSGMLEEINAGDQISDPTITVDISENGTPVTSLTVDEGKGMYCV